MQDSSVFSEVQVMPFKRTIINATQHAATEDQKREGVFDLEPEQKKLLSELLTFEDIPTSREVQLRAEKIYKLLCIVAKRENVESVMIAGAPFLMPVLQSVLHKDGFTVLYAFSKRVSEEVEKDGVVTKINVFRHVGFVEVF